MHYHIYWGKTLMASFLVKAHRDQLLKEWYCAAPHLISEITAKDD